MNLGHLLHDACPEGETIVSYISSPTKLHRNHMIHNAYLWVRVKLANDFRDDPQSSRTKRAHVPRRKNKPYKWGITSPCISLILRYMSASCSRPCMRSSSAILTTTSRPRKYARNAADIVWPIVIDVWMTSRCRKTDKVGLSGLAGIIGNVGDATPEVVNTTEAEDLSPG